MQRSSFFSLTNSGPQSRNRCMTIELSTVICFAMQCKQNNVDNLMDNIMTKAKSRFIDIAYGNNANIN